MFLKKFLKKFDRLVVPFGCSCFFKPSIDIEFGRNSINPDEDDVTIKVTPSAATESAPEAEVQQTSLLDATIEAPTEE